MAAGLRASSKAWRCWRWRHAGGGLLAGALFLGGGLERARSGPSWAGLARVLLLRLQEPMRRRGGALVGAGSVEAGSAPVRMVRGGLLQVAEALLCGGGFWMLGQRPQDKHMWFCIRRGRRCHGWTPARNGRWGSVVGNSAALLGLLLPLLRSRRGSNSERKLSTDRESVPTTAAPSGVALFLVCVVVEF
jgi:hypothetical protein